MPGRGGARRNAGRKTGALRAASIAAREVASGHQSSMAAFLNQGRVESAQTAASARQDIPPAAPPAPAPPAPAEVSPTSEPVTTWKKYLSQLAQAIRQQVSNNNGPHWTALSEGSNWFRPSCPARAPVSKGACVYAYPDLFVWHPELSYQCKIECPYCRENSDLVGDGWGETRSVVGLGRPYFLMSYRYKCKNDHQPYLPDSSGPYRFLASIAEVVQQLPLHFQSLFPAYLCKKLSLDRDVLSLLVSLRVEHATMAPFRAHINRRWEEELVTAQTSMMSKVTDFIFNSPTVLRDGRIALITADRDRFRLKADDFRCGISLPSKVTWERLWRDHHFENRAPAMTRIQSCFPTGAHGGTDTSFKFTKKTPFHGLQLTMNNDQKFVVAAKLLYTNSQEELLEMFREIGAIQSRTNEVYLTFTSDLGTQQGLVDDMLFDSLAARRLHLQSLGQADGVDNFPVLQLPNLGNCDPVLRVTATQAVNNVLSSWLQIADASASEIVVGLDAEWDKTEVPHRASVIQLSFPNQPVLVIETRLLDRDPSHQSVMPFRLRQFFCHSQIAFAGKQIGGDFQKIASRFSNFNEDLVLDDRRRELGSFAKRRLGSTVIPNAGISLVKLLQIVTGWTLSKALRESTRWSQPLSDEAVLYAALDAYAARLLYDRIAAVPELSRYSAEDMPSEGDWVDVLNRNGKIAALGVVNRWPTDSKWNGAIWNQRQHALVTIVTVHIGSTPVEGGDPLGNDRAFMWKLKQLQSSTHVKPEFEQIRQLSGRALNDLTDTIPLPISPVWSRFRGWLRHGAISQGDCFVDSLLWLLNRDRDWDLNSANDLPPESRPARPYRNLRAVQRATACGKIRDQIAQCIERQSVPSFEAMLTDSPFDRDHFVNGIRSSGSRAQSRDHLDDELTEAVCRVLGIRVLILRSRWRLDSSKVYHFMSWSGLPQSNVIGAIFHHQQNESYDAPSNGHFEPVFPADGIDRDAVLQGVPVDIPLAQLEVLGPFLRGSEEQVRVERILASSRESASPVRDGLISFVSSIIMNDGFHCLKRVADSVSRKNSLSLQFCHRLRDALYVDNPDDKRKLLQILCRERAKDELSERELFRVRESTRWRRHVRRHIPAREELRANVEAVIERFRGVQDVKGDLVLSDAVHAELRKLLAEIDRGRVSDPPGLSMYVLVETDANGLPVWRSLRGTNSCENLHLFLSMYTKGVMSMSAPLAVALLMEFLFSWNVTQALRYWWPKEFGTTDIFILENLTRLDREFAEKFQIPVLYSEYEWYPQVNNIRDPGPFVISRIPTGGEFAVLSPISDAGSEELERLQPTSTADAVIARFQQLPRPITGIESRDERDLFRELLPQFQLENGVKLNGREMALEWNRRVIATPQSKLNPKLGCILEAYLPIYLRQEERLMSDAKAFEELELGLLLDDMQATYLGPDESELARLLGVHGAIDPTWLDLDDNAACAVAPSHTSIRSTAVASTVIPQPEQPPEPPNTTRKAKKSRRAQKVRSGKVRERRRKRCANCFSDECPAPYRKGGAATCVNPPQATSLAEGSKTLLKNRRKADSLECEKCRSATCRGRYAGFVCDNPTRPT